MSPEKLPQAKHYLYPNQQQFKHSLDFIHAFIKCDYNIDMHVQEFVEINIIICGSGMHYIEDRRLQANRGDIFIIPPHTAHGYVGGEGFDVYHFLISTQFMEKYIADLQLLPSFFILFKAEPLIRGNNRKLLHLTMTDEQFLQIEVLLRELQKYSSPETPAASIICNSLAMMLIASLCEMYTKNTNKTDSSSIHNDEAFLNALALIQERYYEKISIARLAKTAQLSRSSFLRKFQEVCRTSPAKYLTQRRIEVAKQMLAHTSLPLFEIAENTGFYDASHFFRIFTAETGMSPTLYRKEHLR